MCLRPRATGYPCCNCRLSAVAPHTAKLLNSVFLDNFDDDAAQLTRINALLSECADRQQPKAETVALRPVKLLVIAPSRDLGRMARDHQHHFPPLVRWLLRGIGARESQTSDLVSYLLFDRGYTEALIELGYADAAAQAGEIKRFLEAGVAAGAFA